MISADLFPDLFDPFTRNAHASRQTARKLLDRAKRAVEAVALKTLHHDGG